MAVVVVVVVVAITTKEMTPVEAEITLTPEATTVEIQVKHFQAVNV